MALLTDHTRFAQMLREMRTMDASCPRPPTFDLSTAPDADPHTEARIAAVAGWLVQHYPPDARRWLDDHAEDLCTPYAIALLMAMLTAPEVSGWEVEIRWRRDLLMLARRRGIASAWAIICGGAEL